ncbi:hypothetical protein WSM22_13760 [Cytophagales bacterium WSM2-2]|nr:hypothetical protein WSM22_13760 [Cytophagales bacterium WSM2-2]
MKLKKFSSSAILLLISLLYVPPLSEVIRYATITSHLFEDLWIQFNQLLYVLAFIIILTVNVVLSWINKKPINYLPIWTTLGIIVFYFVYGLITGYSFIFSDSTIRVSDARPISNKLGEKKYWSHQEDSVYRLLENNLKLASSQLADSTKSIEMLLATYENTKPKATDSVKEMKFIQMMNKVIIALSLADYYSISSCIDKRTGLYVIHPTGPFERYEHWKSLKENSAYFLTYKYSSEVKFEMRNQFMLTYQQINYSHFPVYNCEEEKWSELGIFTDTTKINHHLSEVISFQKNELKDRISPNRLSKIYDLELKSRRIVRTSGYIFYLSYLRNNWWLTIIDTACYRCDI